MVKGVQKVTRCQKKKFIKILESCEHSVMELYHKIPEGGRRTDFGLLKKKYATALKPAADGPSEKRCEKPQHGKKYATSPKHDGQGL